MDLKKKLFPSSRLSKELRHPRKGRRLLRKIFGWVALFILTLLILFVIRMRLASGNGLVSPISVISSTKTGKSFSSQVDTIQNLCQKYQLHCQTVTEGLDNSASITLDTGTVAILSFSKDIDKQIASLQLTESRLTIEGKKLSKIDFRFDRPVVTF